MAQEDFHSGELIILAHVQSFRLGTVEIHPPTRQVEEGVSYETLEPRVMQVLIALAEAKGAVVTSDELIQRCWNGRIVGENAIHRVISRIRHLAATLGNGSFRIETIAKVGYRLIVEGAKPKQVAADAPRPRPLASRRTLLGGAAAAVAVAVAVPAGYFLLRKWNATSRRRPR
jgi:DNA-binding winged helix-turn-helix (wHTH) protein